MKAAELQVIADRKARDAARAAFDRRYIALKADMEERGIGGRILDETLDQAMDVFDEAVAVAEENRGVVAGTLGALVLWLLRNPIIAAARDFYDVIQLKLEDMDGDRKE